MNRAIIVLPYYGALPWYFSYFLKSVEGRCFDILFVSDLYVRNPPVELKQLRLSFAELGALIMEKVPGAKLFSDTRKLCDYKPMYGLIFEDFVKGYDYWGFGDCDLIYGGAIDSLLTRLFNEGRDVVSFRKHWISGSLCFLKNTQRMCEVYKEARDLQDVFENEHCVCFDELGGYWFDDLMNGRMTMEDCRRQKEYFTALLWRISDIDFFHEDIMHEDRLANRILRVKEGSIYAGLEEKYAFHYINVKRNPAFKKNWLESGSKLEDYIITKAGIFSGWRKGLWRIIWLYRVVVFHIRIRMSYE